MAAPTPQPYRLYLTLLFSGLLQGAFVVFSFGQSAVAGQVTDRTSAPVPFANVYLERDGIITQLTTTNEAGRYQLTGVDTGQYRFNVTAIGYRRYDRVLDIYERQHIDMDVRLDVDTLMLQQIVIMENRPVSTKGDTVVYDAQYFSTGNEQVLEDLLKKLPGVTVLENGRVQFQGRDISKIKIENDDLFNSQYTLLTKNLSADLVEQVEILQDYSDNPLLKGIENTDDVAMNLTLKEDRKKTLFGDAKMATNFKDRHDAKVNLVSLMEKIKIYGLSNFNNLGEDPTGDVEDLVNPNRITGKTVGDGVASEDIVNILRPAIPEFKRERYLFNNAKFGAVSGIYKPFQHTRIHVTGYVSEDNQPFYQKTSTRYYTPADTVPFYEATDSEITHSVKYLSANLTHTINKSTNMVYRYFYNGVNTGENQLHVFNLQDVSKTLKTRSAIQDHHFNLTKRILDKSALTLDLRHIKDARPQEMFIDGNVLNGFFNIIPPSDTLLQNTSFHTTFWAAEANFFTNVKNGKLGLRTGAKRTEETVWSALDFAATPYSENWLTRKQHQFYTDAYYAMRHKNFTVLPSLSLQQTNLTFTDRKNHNYFFVNPKLSLQWTAGRSRVSVLASINNSMPATSQLIKAPVVMTYNAVAVNDSSFRSFAHQTLLATYTYGGWQDGLSFNASCFYQKARNAYLINTYIEENYLVSIRSRVADRAMASFSFTADKYFSQISSGVKLSVQRSHASFISLVEDVAANTTSVSNRAELSFRTAFIGNFNFHAGHVLNSASSRSHFIDAINFVSQSYFDLYVKALGRNLHGTFHLERFDLISVETRPVFYFLDINLKYDLPKSRFGFFVKGKNLLNENLYQQRTVSHLNTSVVSNNLIPRYLLLGLNVRL